MHSKHRVLAGAGGAVLAAVMLAAAVLVAGFSAAPASAAGVSYPRPGNGVFTFDGRGWGHGRGMSQYGAQGAAGVKSLTAAQITAFYYKGTTLGALPDSNIKVRVACDGSRTTCTSVPLSGAQGLRFRDLASGAAKDLPTDRTRWRVRVDAAGFHLDGLLNGAWVAEPVGGSAVFAGPVEVHRRSTSTAPAIRVWYPRTTGTTWREYRGFFRFHRAGSTTARLVNVLPMEAYLLGVVPRESISSWPAAALQSQAIAARSYAGFIRAGAASSAEYHICDTTQCQVYGGYAYGTADGKSYNLEPASTSAAVRATAEQVRWYDGGPIFAQYSASNGGWSTQGSRPYLVAQEDPYDGLTGSHVHAWSGKVPATALEAAYPAVGTLVRLTVLERDGNGPWGGRVLKVRLEGRSSSGAATAVDITGADVMRARPWPTYADGLKSSWWQVTSIPLRTFGPASAARGATVTYTGTASPATAVEVWSQGPHQSAGVRRATVLSDAAGRWRVALQLNQDAAVWAAAGGLTSRRVVTDVAGTTITAPRRVKAGTRVLARGYAEPGSVVTVCWQHSTAACATSARVTAAADGYWSHAHGVARQHVVSAAAAGHTSPLWTIRLS